MKLKKGQRVLINLKTHTVGEKLRNGDRRFYSEDGSSVDIPMDWMHTVTPILKQTKGSR